MPGTDSDSIELNARENTPLTRDKPVMQSEIDTPHPEKQEVKQGVPCVDCQEPDELSKKIILKALRRGNSKYMDIVHFLLENPERSNPGLYFDGTLIRKKLFTEETYDTLITYLEAITIVGVNLELIQFNEKLMLYLKETQSIDIESYRKIFFDHTKELREGLPELFDYRIGSQMRALGFKEEKKEQIYARFLTKTRFLLPESYEVADKKVRSTFCLDGALPNYNLDKTLNLLSTHLSTEFTRTYNALTEAINYRPKLLDGKDEELSVHNLKTKKYLLDLAKKIMGDNNDKRGIPAEFREHVKDLDHLMQLMGRVPVNRIEESTGSNLALLAIQYGNEALYYSLNSFNADRFQTNLREMTAAYYFSSQKQPLYIEKYDNEGQLLRRMEKDLLAYEEQWYKEENERIRQNNSKNVIDILLSLLRSKKNENTHKMRIIELKKYLKRIEEASAQLAPKDFLDQINDIYKTRAIDFFLIDSRLNRIVKAYINKIKTDDKYHLLRHNDPAMERAWAQAREESYKKLLTSFYERLQKEEKNFSHQEEILTQEACSVEKSKLTLAVMSTDRKKGFSNGFGRFNESEQPDLAMRRSYIYLKSLQYQIRACLTTFTSRDGMLSDEHKKLMSLLQQGNWLSNGSDGVIWVIYRELFEKISEIPLRPKADGQRFFSFFLKIYQQMKKYLQSLFSKNRSEEQTSAMQTNLTQDGILDNNSNADFNVKSYDLPQKITPEITEISQKNKKFEVKMNSLFNFFENSQRNPSSPSTENTESENKSPGFFK